MIIPRAQSPLPCNIKSSQAQLPGASGTEDDPVPYRGLQRKWNGYIFFLHCCFSWSQGLSSVYCCPWLFLLLCSVRLSGIHGPRRPCCVVISHKGLVWSHRVDCVPAFSLNVPPQKLFGGLRRPQLWATGDWQLCHDNVPALELCLMQSFLVKHQITQVTHPPTAPIWCPVTFGFSQN